MGISELIKNMLKEAQDMLDSKTVVGKPIQAGDYTVIPVSKIVFGFGGGGGESPENHPGGSGQGVGGGWSIEPMAFIVLGKDGAKLMTIGDKENLSTKLMDLAPKVVDTIKDFVDQKKKTEKKSRKGTSS
ncbi:MAG: GerW family sporulation protein [Fidelibacterota bacterium]